MNEEIITLITRLAQISEIRGETHRAKAFLGAVLGIRALKWNIKDNIERVKAEKIPGVGKGIKNKLIEYVSTGAIAELVELENSSSVRAYTELSGIAGAGPKTVAGWIRAGINSISDLRKKLAIGEIELTDMQKYGLIYYSDLLQRIPRDEVAALGELVISLIKKLEPNAECEITGSYRRGTSTSGDIDIITTGSHSLQDLIAELRADPNFIDTFMLGSERTTFIYKSFISGKVRQIDVLRLPRAQYWAGILYFTGSWEFNAAMRGYAKSRGYLLNQRGLFKLRGRTEKLVTVSSERDIFTIIGIKYVEPSERSGPDNIVFANK
jgi:DNA polymerase/3'-5' exonuclease PolX